MKTAILQSSIIAEDEANRRQTPENYFFHDFVRDAENYRQAIAIYESRKDINKAVKNRESPGDLHQFAHNPGEKESGYPRRRTIACGIGVLFGGGRFLKRVGGLYIDIGQVEAAGEWYEKSGRAVKNAPPHGRPGKDF